MKKRIAFSFALLMGVCLCGQAQQRVVRIHSGGQPVYTTPTNGSNRLYFEGNQAHFSHNGADWSIPIASIDSLTFGWSDTTQADGISITWDGDEVTIVNGCADLGVSITHDGGHVTVTSTADSADLTYVLSGSSQNGSLTLTSANKIILYLDHLTLTNPAGPAIWMKSDKRVQVQLQDTSRLSDGAASTAKGALQCQGKLELKGSGTLQVSGLAKHGIQTSGSTTLTSGHVQVLTAVKDGLNVDNFVMNGGQLVVNSLGDGVDGDQGYIEINGGSLSITCATDDVKGLCCDSSLTINGGTVDITVSGDQSKGIKTKGDLLLAGGTVTVQATGSVVMENAGSGYNPSYCTGIKVNGNMHMTDGDLTVTCPTTNAGGKAISVDGDIFLDGGALHLSALGSCAIYTDSTGTANKYAATCLKADGNITVSGGVDTLIASGRAISTDGHFSQTGGNLTLSTSANGFTTIGTGRNCTDGFGPACLKADGNIVLSRGVMTTNSTGTGGCGILADGTLTFGVVDSADSLLVVKVRTSGAAVNASGGGGGWPGGGGSTDYWKGLPKGVKIKGNITINSGHLQSFCAQTSGDPTGEAIETKDTLVINGGYVEANAFDDALNAASHILINGGYIWAYARGNDGLDCNGNNIRINGGTILAYGSECGVDDNADNGGIHLYIQNATMVVVGGNMGAIEGTPSLTGQKYLVLGSSGGGGWPGGGGGSGLTMARNGFCIKSGDTEVLTYKMPNITSGSSGFEEIGAKRVNGIFVTTPSIQSGTYTYYTSPTITGGTSWHGLYDGATVTTSGNGTNTTAR